MDELERIGIALKNAHEAGDVQAATALAQHYKTTQSKQTQEPSILDRIGSGVSATARTAGSLIGIVPQLARGLGEFALTDADAGTALERAESSNPMTHFNKTVKPNELTQRGMEVQQEGLDKLQTAAGRLVRMPFEFTGIAGLPEHEQNILRKNIKSPQEQMEFDKAMAAQETGGEFLGNFLPVPFLKKGKGKSTPETKDLDKRASIDRVLAEQETSKSNYKDYASDYADFVNNLNFAKEARRKTEEVRNTPIQLSDKLNDPTLPKINESLILRGAEREHPLPTIVGPEGARQWGVNKENVSTDVPLAVAKTIEKTDNNYVPFTKGGAGRLSSPGRGEHPNVRTMRDAEGNVLKENPSTVPDTVAMATNHTHPTMEFPLRPEVHESSARTLDIFRKERESLQNEIARLEVEKAKGGKQAVERAAEQRNAESRLKSIEATLRDFGDTGYEVGQRKPGLFGFGKETLAPIQKTGSLSTGFGKSQRGSVNPLSDSPVLNALGKLFSKKEEAPKTNFEKAGELKEATKGLPNKEVYDGITSVEMNPTKFIETQKDWIDSSKDLTPFEKAKALTTTAGMNLAAWAHKNPLFKFGYDHVNRANETALRNIDEHVQPMVEALSNVKTDLKDAWHALTKVEGRTQWSREMLDRTNLSEAEKHLVSQVQDMWSTVYKKINETREYLGQKPIPERPGYIASVFLGDYRTLVKDKTTGKIMYVVSENNKISHNNALKNIKEKLDTKNLSFEEVPYGNNIRKSSSMDAGYQAFLEQLITDDPRAEAIHSIYTDWKKNSDVNYKGETQHFKYKSETAVGGAEGYKANRNETQNALDGFKAQIRAAENALHWVEMQKAAKDIREVLTNKSIQNNKSASHTVLSEYLDNALGFRENALGALSDGIEKAFHKIGAGASKPEQISAVFRAAINTKLLGGPFNLMFYWMQYAQVMNALPMMSSAKRAIGIENGFAINDMAAGSRKIYLSKDPFWQEANAYMKDNHVSKAAIDINAADIGMNPLAKMADTVWNGPRRGVEAASRGVVFGGFVEAFRKHMPKEEAFKMAAAATERSLADYRNFERAMALSSGGFLGKNVGALRTYMINLANQFAGFSKRGEYSQAAMLFGITTFSSGLLGAIGIQQAEMLIDVWNSVLGEKVGRVPSFKEAIAKNGNKWFGKMSDTIAYGPHSSILGMDVSSRMGFNQVAPGSVADLVMPGSSDLGRAAGSVFNAAIRPTQDNFNRALNDLNPTSTKWMTEQGLFTEKNVSTGKDHMVNPKTMDQREYARTTGDIVKRMAGGRSLEESKSLSKDFIKGTEEHSIKDMHTKVLDKWESEWTRAKTPFAKGRITQEAVKSYLNIGKVDPDTIISQMETRIKQRYLTPSQREAMAVDPYKMQRSMQYGR